jgi:hypothetical protein
LVTGLKGLYFNMDAKLNIATQLLNYNNNWFMVSHLCQLHAVDSS